MVTSGWKVVGEELRVVWKSASMENGGQCVMTHGTLLIPALYVANLGSREKVCANCQIVRLELLPYPIQAKSEIRMLERDIFSCK